MCLTTIGEHGFKFCCYLHDLAHVASFFVAIHYTWLLCILVLLLFTILGESEFHFGCYLAYLLQFESDMFTNLQTPL